MIARRPGIAGFCFVDPRLAGMWCLLPPRNLSLHGPGIPTTPAPTTVLAQMFYKKARVEYHPVGVVGAIVPWNYPFHNILNPLTAAVFAGNGVVIKVCGSARGVGRALGYSGRDIWVRGGTPPASAAPALCMLWKERQRPAVFIGQPVTHPHPGTHTSYASSRHSNLSSSPKGLRARHLVGPGIPARDRRRAGGRGRAPGPGPHRDRLRRGRQRAGHRRRGQAHLRGQHCHRAQGGAAWGGRGSSGR